MLFALLAICVVLFVVLPAIGATLMAAVWALITGLVLGLIGKSIAPGSKGNLSLTVTMLIGVAGGLIGRIVGRGLHAHRLGDLALEILVTAGLVTVTRGGKRVSGTRLVSGRKSKA